MLRRDLVDLKNMRSHDTPVASGVRIPEIVAQILGENPLHIIMFLPLLYFKPDV